MRNGYAGLVRASAETTCGDPRSLRSPHRPVADTLALTQAEPLLTQPLPWHVHSPASPFCRRLF
eukprot:1593558-Prymnesium_polylepis.1